MGYTELSCTYKEKTGTIIIGETELLEICIQVQSNCSSPVGSKLEEQTQMLCYGLKNAMLHLSSWKKPLTLF